MDGMASGLSAPTTISAAKSAPRKMPRAGSSSKPRVLHPGRIGLDDGLAVRSLESTRKLLATKHGIVLLQPAYSKYYIELGEISSYPPATKKTPAFSATTIVGRHRRNACRQRRRRHDYYNRINPSAREEISDVHRCEPYVYAQMIAGRDAPTFGEAKNSWLTGTAPGTTTPSRNGFLASARPTTAC